MSGLTPLTIAEFIRRVESGAIRLSDFYRELMIRIAEKDKELKAFESFDPSLVLARAAAIEAGRAGGEKLGRLYGVPIGVKDVINTRSLPTGRGSAHWKGYQAGNNARVVDTLEGEGGVTVGKTVTAELAVHHPGPTMNPHGALYSPGTSSMGSAVAVSAGLAIAALGTQTGSSIIRPASYTGVFGMKPSYGVVPRTGVLKTTDTLDHVGFFANHAEDLRVLLDVFRVRGSNYPVSDRRLTEQAEPQNRLCAGVLRPRYLWKNYQPYVREAFEAQIEKLAGNPGIQVESIEDDGWFDASHRIHATLYDKSLWYYFCKESQNRSGISSTLASMIDHGAGITPEEFRAALGEQERMQIAFDARFAPYDILLTPSTANIAPLRAAYREVDDTGLIWSLLGTPSVNIPVFRGPDEMPFGLQATGVKYSDYRLLAIIEKWCREEILIPRLRVNHEMKAKVSR